MNRFSAPPLGLSHPLAYGGLRTTEGRSQWRLSTVQSGGHVGETEAAAEPPHPAPQGEGLALPLASRNEAAL